MLSILLVSEVWILCCVSAETIWDMISLRKGKWQKK